VPVNGVVGGATVSASDARDLNDVLQPERLKKKTAL